MADFWTDLARHLAEYERAEVAAEAENEWIEDHPDRPDLDLEVRDLISEDDVLPETHTNLARTA